jgi:hypothetical protein
VQQLYYQALSGRAAVLLESDGQQLAETRTSLRLTRNTDPDWYRVALAHRALHEELGTFTCRDLLSRLRSAPELGSAVACFVLLEDLRIDTGLTRRYPGLKPALQKLQQQELARRPPLETQSGAAAILELLTRMTLGDSGSAPAWLSSDVRQLSLLLASVKPPNSSVEDALAAALNLCRRLPHLRAQIAPVTYRDMLASRLGISFHTHDAEDPTNLESDSDDLVDEASPAEVLRSPSSQSLRSTATDDIGANATPTPRFLYPEWDHRAGTYRSAWCTVHESLARGSGSTELYRAVLRERRGLVAAISRQFERIAPEGLRRVRGASFGEELDLDAAIEAMADLRAGIPPSDKLYVRRERAQRDVSVVFLIDLSASTEESVLSERKRRRILDIERDSLILLIEPLARVRDLFGMYGFSGTNRHNVQLVVIKDIDASLNADVLSRLGGLQPIQTTRMGAAIRHGVAKLSRHHSSTRLLIVISDGRPFDVDYGQQYGSGAEVEYAIKDTRMALDEARAAGIRPFLLTVDSQGMDYMRSMCDGVDYELLTNVSQLPSRLAHLYQHLTAPASPFPVP